MALRPSNHMYPTMGLQSLMMNAFAILLAAASRPGCIPGFPELLALAAAARCSDVAGPAYTTVGLLHKEIHSFCTT